MLARSLFLLIPTALACLLLMAGSTVQAAENISPSQAATVEAAQQIYFPCRNMNDGRFLVHGPDWAKKMMSLGYKKDMGYKVLKSPRTFQNARMSGRMEFVFSRLSRLSSRNDLTMVLATESSETLP